MKLVFYISLGLNLLLVAGMIQHKFTERSGAPLAREEKQVAVVASPSAAEEPAIVEVAGTPFHWRQLESEDYHRYAANLRAIGCPEGTVQEILHSDVLKAYAAKLRELHKGMGVDRNGRSAEYWKSDKANHAVRMARAREVLRLNLEKHELLYALLGVDIEQVKKLRHGLPDTEGVKLAFLSAHKITLAQEIMMRFVEMGRTLNDKYEDYWGEEVGRERMALGKEREAELLKVMTTSELLEYKLRQFPQAGSLRYSLEAFEPMEGEFRALYVIEEKYERPAGALVEEGDEAGMQQWRALDEQRLNEQRQLLGEARFQEYIRGQQSEYKDLHRLVQQNNLPKQTSAKVYDMWMAAETQVNKLLDNPNLSAEQQEQAVTQIRELTQKSVRGVVGEKVYEQYKRTGGGYWLEGLGKPGTPRSDPRMMFR